uniref:Reverse transcriptase domain-containing protein n=1 Tax=Trichuris muris TaxID=70415 RepID=A0A5S6QNQ5_TRIMR
MVPGLPTVRIAVDGVERSALVDTGCTRCIAHVSCCRRWRGRTVGMTALNGGQLCGCGVGTVWLQPAGRVGARAEVIVSQTKPLGFDLILGMNGIKVLGGVIVDAQGHASFRPNGGTACAATEDRDIKLDQPDFSVSFDREKLCWTAAWKWGDGKGPDVLKNVIPEYPPPKDARALYEEELRKWIDQGWLVPYDESKYGPARGLIPLMAVVQLSKEKVRPVMDYRELNGHVEAFTANADVCAVKLREWRRKGLNLAMVDLNNAYLQIRTDKSLWPYQTVIFKGRKYCLTRLGFGLNVAPLIMRTVLNHVLAQNAVVRKGTSAYIDDILVNEDIVSARQVQEHLAQYGLSIKAPENVANGARILGLRVWGSMAG